MIGDPPQLPLPLPYEPRYRRDDFIWAPSNEAARVFLDHDETWPQRRLALWGAAGSGKTHLLRLWAARTGATVTTGIDLARLRADPGGDRFAPGAMAIDDAALCPEPTVLLHLLNRCAETGAPVLMAAGDPPARWPVRLPDLVSRLRATTAVRIEAPDPELLRGLLARLAADRQMTLSQQLQDSMLLHLPRSAASLREAVARLDQLALAAQQKPTRALFARVIAEMSATSEEFVALPENADCAAGPG